MLAALAVVLHGGQLTAGVVHGTEAERAEQRVERALGMSLDTTVIATFATDDVTRIDRALAPLHSNPKVRSVIGPSTWLPALHGRMVDHTRHSAYALLLLAGDFEDAVAAYPGVRGAITGVPFALTGHVAFQHDLDAMLHRDLVRGEVVALPITIGVLLFAFRTALAAILPVAVGSLAVLCGVAIILSLSHVLEIASYTINIVSLIGLGVAIDYSLFAVSRYREELAAGRDYPTALLTMLRSSGRVIVFSGLAVGTGLVALCFFNGSYLASMGLGGAIVVALSVVCALTIVPALLVVFGPRIHAARKTFRRPRVAWILARPLRVLVPSVVLLLVLAAPFAHLRMASVDMSVLETTDEARRGLDALSASFPDIARTRIYVTTRDDAPPDLPRQLAAIPGVTSVEEAAGSVLFVLTDAPPQSETAHQIVRHIRAANLADSLAVGGQPALDFDSAHFIAARTPYAIGFLVVVMLAVLAATFRSVVLPIKAVLLNFLSIAASLGAMVWVFQEGHLFLSAPRPIDPAVPVLQFCILFGLSMDYHVLMLSRIRESYLEDHDNDRAVRSGLERSARLITSAAAIMVSVFSAFALARFVVIRSVGFGMAFAVALDATIVRLLLVPASMKLLGRWNWWPASVARHA